MNGAEDSPLGLDLGEAAQEELAKPRACLIWPKTARRPACAGGSGCAGRRAERVAMAATAAATLARLPVADTAPCFCRPGDVAPDIALLEAARLSSEQ